MVACSGSTSHRKIRKRNVNIYSLHLLVVIKHRHLKVSTGYLIICIAVLFKDIDKYRQGI